MEKDRKQELNNIFTELKSVMEKESVSPSQTEIVKFRYIYNAFKQRVNIIFNGTR